MNRFFCAGRCLLDLPCGLALLSRQVGLTYLDIVVRALAVILVTWSANSGAEICFVLEGVGVPRWVAALFAPASPI